MKQKNPFSLDLKNPATLARLRKLAGQAGQAGQAGKSATLAPIAGPAYRAPKSATWTPSPAFRREIPTKIPSRLGPDGIFRAQLADRDSEIARLRAELSALQGTRHEN